MPSKLRHICDSTHVCCYAIHLILEAAAITIHDEFYEQGQIPLPPVLCTLPQHVFHSTAHLRDFSLFQQTNSCV